MTFGTCRYCGQVVNLDYEEETQAEADIAASENANATTHGMNGICASRSRRRKTAFTRFSGTMLQSWALPRLLPKNRCNS